jgi:endoglucanase
MKKKSTISLLLFFVSTMLWAAPPTVSANIKIDQFGYPVNARKIAFISNPITGYNNTQTFTPGKVYQVRNAATDAVVYTGMPAAWKGGQLHTQSGDKVWWFDFSNVTATGSYYIFDVANNVGSYTFNINNNVYDGVLKAAAKMFYYNRRGFAKVAPYSGIWTDPNPSFVGPGQDREARLVTDQNNAATARDVSGGWFDAGDYFKYTTFTFGVFTDLLLAYEDHKTIWGDDTNIPESGNGVPDILDEVKWEMDWLLKMQNADGSVLSKVGYGLSGGTKALTPSENKDPQYYGAQSTSATLTGSMAFALGAIQYKSLSNPAMQAYGNTLQAASIKAWDWATANPNVLFVNAGSFYSVDCEVNDYYRKAFRVVAAAYLFALTNNSIYKTYFDANYEILNCVKPVGSYASLYEQEFQSAVLYYAKTPGATISVVANIKTKLRDNIKDAPEYFANYLNQNDAYRAFLDDDKFTWGSNKTKSNGGNTYAAMVLNNLDAANNDRYKEALMGYVNYIHGTNATGYSFLTNMAGYGAENSVQKMYHSWFGPFYAGTFSGNTAPGYLTGGPNKFYAPAAGYTGVVPSPPTNQPAAKSYLDFDTDGDILSYSISEPAIYYQSAYIKMLSNVVGGVTTPPADAIAPTMPANLSVAKLLPASFTLNWAASTDNIDVVAYEIYNNGIKIFESTSNTMLFDGLKPDSTLTLTIKAKDRTGNLSPVSTILNVTTPLLDTQPPTAPINLIAANTTQASTILRWGAATDNLGVTQYEVFKDGVSVGFSSVLELPVAGLMANTTYIFTVKAKDAAGNISTASAPLSVTTTNTPAPDKVLYDEVLLTGWVDYSWTTTRDFASTNPVKVGAVATKQNFVDPYQGMAFHAITTADAIYTATYPGGIGFWVFAEGIGTSNFSITTLDSADNQGTTKDITIQAGVWTYFNIPWADLGNPSQLSTIWFQETNGNRTVNFDDIRFLSIVPVTTQPDEVIYGDTLGTGWSNYSYNDVNFNFDNTAPEVKNGTTSIKAVIVDNYEAASFHKATPIDITQFKGGIQFWAFGKTAVSPDTKVKLRVFSEADGTTLPGTVQKDIEIATGVWTLVTVPWAELGIPSQNLVQRINIANNIGAGGQAYFLDDVKILGQATGPVAPPTDLIIYGDALSAGWSNYSYAETDFNFSNTAPEIKAGTASIKSVISAYYDAASFRKSAAIDITQYSGGVQFWAYGKKASGANTKVKLQVFSEADGTTVAGTTQKQIELDLYKWTLVTIPWDSLGITSQKLFQRLTIQNNSLEAGQEFFLDEIKVLAKVPVLCNSIKSGSWIDPMVWSTGSVPAAADIVTISATHNVSMPSGNYPVKEELINNGTLSGIGIVAGSLLNNGIMSPGNPTGGITIAENFAAAPSSVYNIEMASSTGYDSINVTGTASLKGTLNVSLQNSFYPATGAVYTIMKYASHTGTFTTVNLPALTSNRTWNLKYNATSITLEVLAGALPVTILEFKATNKEDDAVLLTWKTSDAVNGNYFEVQISNDGRLFKGIAKISIDNSRPVNNYKYLDKKPFYGLNYYRLKIIDFDGRFIFSEIIRIIIKDDKQIKIYPNPATDCLHFTGKGNVSNVLIFSIDGKLIAKFSGPQSSINIQNYKKGTYIIQYQYKGKTVQAQFIKQ